jgi:hypothetical protein
LCWEQELSFSESEPAWKNQQNRLSENFGNQNRIQNQEIVDVEEKVVCRVDQGIKTTQTRPVTVVANVESVEKIFIRNQSNALL